MKLDLKNIDSKYKKTIENVENKPHVKYIRYLLSKRYSPIVIKKELQKLGLSAPHEKTLTVYYLTILDPVIKYFGLSSLYAEYKNRLLRANSKRGEYSKNILNYRMHLGEDLDSQVKFCKMICELEIDPMWCNEIYRFHGSAANLPVDELGNRLLSTTTSTRGEGSVERVLLFSKRYLIDKLLLENVPIDRIATYCRENLKFNVYGKDIKLYKTMFFNIQTQTLEEKIKSLDYEKNSLNLLLQDIDRGAGEFEELSIGEKISLIDQTNKRIEALDDNIKGLNMFYTEAAVNIAKINEESFEDMFADVVGRTYKRFAQLDQNKDRDVVEPLFKCARIMSLAHDKVETIKALNGGGAGIGDKHSQSVVLELYSKRVDEIADEEIKRVAELTGDINYGKVCIDDIDGIDELSINVNDTDI